MKFLLPLIISLLIFAGCDKKQSGEHNHNDDGHSHGGHGHSHDQIGNAGQKLVIGEEAIKNMGAEIKALNVSDFTVFKRIPAKVVNLATSKNTLYSPWGGIISRINATVSEWKSPENIVVEITRDPLPRMTLTATDTILKVSAEDYHEALMAWRKTKSKLSTLKLEHERLNKIVNTVSGELPIVPKKDLIKLKYDIIITKEELEALEHKLILHGLGEDQVERLKDFADGHEIITPGVNFWINALKANGLWKEAQAGFLKILPEKLRSRRWTVQCIAELFSGDYLSQEELEVFKKDRILLENFSATAALVQKGYTLRQLKELASGGFFNDTIRLKVPVASCIEKIRVRMGQKVERGASLIDLHSPENMIFELEARGSEKIDLRSAVSSDSVLTLKPVTENAAGVYSDLKILSILTAEEDGLIKALVPVKNNIIADRKVDNRRYLSWDLVEGTRYYANIPVKQLKGVFVLPAQAVLDSGPDKVILVREGDNFTERKVIVLHRDSKVAVLSKDSDFIPGEPVVFKNAFEVLQAVHSGTKQAVDPHAGHSH